MKMRKFQEIENLDEYKTRPDTVKNISLHRIVEEPKQQIANRLHECIKADGYVRLGYVIEKEFSLSEPHSFYKSIAAIANLRKTSPILKFGRMYMKKISADGISFHLPDCPKCTLAFSRVLFNEEILVVYHSSVCDAKVEYIEVD